MSMEGNKHFQGIIQKFSRWASCGGNFFQWQRRAEGDQLSRRQTPSSLDSTSLTEKTQRKEFNVWYLHLPKESAAFTRVS